MLTLFMHPLKPAKGRDGPTIALNNRFQGEGIMLSTSIPHAFSRAQCTASNVSVDANAW